MGKHYAVSTLCALALWVSGCVPGRTGTDITGTVQSEVGAPLPAAQIRIDRVKSQSVDGTGRFTVHVDTAHTQLTFSAPGYATIERTLPVRGGALDLAVIRLRPVDTTQTVTLPAAGAPPVSVQVQVGLGGSTLSIPAGAMVTGAGAVAQGNVQVSMTYWHPEAPLDSAPGLLLATQGNAVVPLATFGMAAMEVRQGDNLLQVASGQRLTWTVAVPPTRQAMLHSTLPNLYYLDPNTALWTLTGTAQDGSVAYDPNAGVFTAQLPHLSDWNIDGWLPASNGGCVTGKVLNACDPTQPMPNTAVKIYFLSSEEVKDWNATSDAAGNYCISTPVSDYEATYNMQHGETTIDVNYVVTGADSMDDTVQCNPLPSECRTCDPFYESWDSRNNFCNKCELYVPHDTGFQEPGIPVLTHYSDTCSPSTPLASLVGCTFCPGSAPAPGSCTLAGSGGAVSGEACATLNPVMVRPAGCNCGVRGNACTAGGCCGGIDGTRSGCNTQGMCAACTPGLVLGSACNPKTDVCCGPPGSAPLTCLDYVCVPTSDPGGADAGLR